MEKFEDFSQIKDWLGAGSINIFGRPFAGKDSQGGRLADLFKGNLVGGGDILRNTVVPDHVKAAIARGELAPSQDYVDIVLPYLSQEKLQNKPLILSAVGRWHGEEEGVMAVLESSAHPLKAVIYLKIPEDVAVDRWRAHEAEKDRGIRADDAEDILIKRFDEFNKKTLPVIEFYRQRNLLIEIDATQPRDEVLAQIMSQLATRTAY